MSRQFAMKGFVRATRCLVFCSITLGLCDRVRAQANQLPDQPPILPQQQILLPPAGGGTPLSFQIQSEALYVSSCGSMLESAAIARKINAEAVAIEIQNSVAYVDAYFQRRELNREWRAKEDPNYLEREKRRQDVFKRRVEEQYQDIERGDVTKTLNWLLRELANPVVAYQYLPANQTLRDSQIDRVLSQRDLQQIRLTDGGSKASRLVFAAGDGKPLSVHWPMALRGIEFATARESYERTLKDVGREIKARGQASPETQTQALASVNDLFVVLDEVYTKERRRDPAQFLDYAAAKRFLQSTLASTYRALSSSDTRLLTDGVQFQGDTLIRLLEHMYKNGFEFDSPEPGGEGTYKSLFQNLRSLYVTIGPNRPAVDLQPMAPPVDAPKGNPSKRAVN
jgi:hypothetical protein